MSAIRNDELVRRVMKAITTDALATGGLLNPAQSDRFIDYVIQETVLKEASRTVRFRNQTLNIDKIGINRRVAVAKQEARDPGIRRGITTSQISLTPSEIMVPIEISDNFREINIEGDNVNETIIKLFARHFANDWEELCLLGNPLGPADLEVNLVENGSQTQYIKDNFLALQTGWQEYADSGHIIDAGGTNIGISLFSQALRALPTKFQKNLRNLRWFMSPNLYHLYSEKISTRATAGGDAAAAGDAFNPLGIKVVKVPLWPLNSKVVEHVTLTGVIAVNLKYKNITNVVVLPSTLAETPTTPYVEGVGNDYILDAAAGTIVRDAASTIPSGATVKVTYSASPQLLLTHMNNFVTGIGREIRIERDRDIFATVDQYAITAKVACQIEETDAVVKVKNIGEGV